MSWSLLITIDVNAKAIAVANDAAAIDFSNFLPTVPEINHQ